MDIVSGPPHEDSSQPTGGEGPVTVIVTRRAKPDKIEQFEKWMDGIIHEAMKFEGHMGVNIIRPSNKENPEYIIIFRFNTVENLAKWENSETRRIWLAKSDGVTDGEAKVEKQSGMEFWFTPSAVAGEVTTGQQTPLPLPAPPRYKMAIVVTGIIFVLVSVLLPPIREATVGLPVLLSTFVGVVIMVLLMTYVVMPSVNRLLRPWLTKKKLF